LLDKDFNWTEFVPFPKLAAAMSGIDEQFARVAAMSGSHRVVIGKAETRKAESPSHQHQL